MAGLVYRAPITATTGTTEIVAAVAGKIIMVLSLVITTDAAVNIKFLSYSTDLTGLYYLDVKGGIAFPHSPFGMLQTAAGQALNINQSGAANIGGNIVYTIGGPANQTGMTAIAQC